MDFTVELTAAPAPDLFVDAAALAKNSTAPSAVSSSAQASPVAYPSLPSQRAQPPHAAQIAPFVHFVAQLNGLIARGLDEAPLLQAARVALQALIATDQWLPSAYAVPSETRYQQYLLHADPQGRFSIVSFVWGPGQATPIHDHTVWGLIGMLRGAERAQAYARQPDGSLLSGEENTLQPGDVDVVSPAVGDIHRVSNAYQDQVSVSIHVYGADIGKVERSVYADDGTPKRFISGYSNGTLPPLLG